MQSCRVCDEGGTGGSIIGNLTVITSEDVFCKKIFKGDKFAFRMLNVALKNKRVKNFVCVSNVEP